jgi:hypothetical protein
MKPRSWQVIPSLRSVLIGAQVVLIILILGGAIFLVIGVKTLVDSQRFEARAVATNGVVVEIAEGVESVRRGSGDNWYYEDVRIFHPVVRFVTAREQEVRFQASEGSQDPWAYGVGDSIGVLYDPANPRAARLDTEVSRRGDSITLITIGLALLVIGAVGYWLLRSPGRAARRAAQQNRPPQEAERRIVGRPGRQVDPHGDQDPGGGAGPTPAP